MYFNNLIACGLTIWTTGLKLTEVREWVGHVIIMCFSSNSFLVVVVVVVLL